MKGLIIVIKRLQEGSTSGRKGIKILDFCTVTPSNSICNVYLYSPMKPGNKLDRLYQEITIYELRQLIGDIWKEYGADSVRLIDFDDSDVDVAVHVW